jgi:hypothetical protein
VVGCGTGEMGRRSAEVKFHMVVSIHASGRFILESLPNVLDIHPLCPWPRCLVF